MNDIMNMIRNTQTIPEVDASKELTINSKENRLRINRFNNEFSRLIESINR